MSGTINEALAVWQSGTAFSLTSGSGYTCVTDGDKVAGMSPMEMVLAGLIACTAADVISILQKKRQAVTGMAARAVGHRSGEHPKVYTAIDVTFVVTGHQVDPEAVRRSIELSETKYCSVSNMLKQTVTITMGFEIVEAEPAVTPGLTEV
jgi:putative redox protein